uniref:Uncharacterized protein n=1 Tax=Guillardia theta TaxID=55529 RepID=A0A7S4NMP3_GUITH|mmetsp:Transcript_26737/g.87637  ORF Transcript_26737/g.87637 Transcript_26737/m.87637 type:complete len:222 (+) Transcript_26737:50-715(+)
MIRMEGQRSDRCSREFRDHRACFSRKTSMGRGGRYVPLDDSSCEEPRQRPQARPVGALFRSSRGSKKGGLDDSGELPCSASDSLELSKIILESTGGKCNKSLEEEGRSSQSRRVGGRLGSFEGWREHGEEDKKETECNDLYKLIKSMNQKNKTLMNVTEELLIEKKRLESAARILRQQLEEKDRLVMELQIENSDMRMRAEVLSQENQQLKERLKLKQMSR